MATTTMNTTTTTTTTTKTARRLVHRTRGQGHGGMTRLMSPGDLGALVKPFVFLDGDFVIASGAKHPHELVLGSSSVHTSEQALPQGEAGYRRIALEMKQRMQRRS